MAAKSGHPPLPPWGNALAGATGAVLANALVYPLDIVKTRLQVQIKRQPSHVPSAHDDDDDEHYASTLHAIQRIVEDEGLAGLYNGIHGALLGVASTNFAYFYWYSTIRAFYLSSRIARSAAGSSGLVAVVPPPSTAVELSLGAAAGAVAQIFTIPVAVVTTRQQTQKKGAKKGLWDTGREVVESEDGWSGLWRGLKASLVLVVNPAITYGAYERLRGVMFKGKTNLKPAEAFLLGAMSKSLATIVTQPLIVAKVGLQSKPPAVRNGKPFKSFLEVMAFVIEHEGPLGLFKGIGPQITKGLLVQGFLMMVKERMEILFVVLFAYLRRVKNEKVKKMADAAAAKAAEVLPK